MSRLFHILLFCHADYIWWAAEIMKLLIMQFAPFRAMYVSLCCCYGCQTCKVLFSQYRFSLIHYMFWHDFVILKCITLSEIQDVTSVMHPSFGTLQIKIFN